MSLFADALRCRAPAKINLYLHVTGRRADGYHLLDSLVVFADLADEVAAVPAATLSLALEGPFAAALPGGAENLVLRAARGLAAAAGRPAGAALMLAKHLPVASGLGGGSADAVATLKALSQLWAVTLDAAEMQALALSLGADVPACLFGRPVQVAGIGEILTPAPLLPPAWLVLANPGEGLATADVFRRFSGPLGSSAPLREAPADAAGLAAALRLRRNDLEAPAQALLPALAAVREALTALPGCLLARMSGSGGTCFGLFGSAGEAEVAAERLAAEQPGWWVRPARLLGPGEA